MMCKSEVLSMNAVIYARYSSDNQREESIEGQIRECTAYAERNGITVVRHYIDRALSAKTDNRPDFQQMIRDSNKKLFEIVLVWKFDRFARNRFDSANYKMILKKNNVHLISVMEPIAEGSQGILVETLLEGMAEYYSAELSEKVEAECIAVIVFDSALAFLSHDKVGSIKLDSDTVGVYLHLYATLRRVCCCDLFYSRSGLVYCKIVIISTSIVKLCIICLDISSDWFSLCKIKWCTLNRCNLTCRNSLGILYRCVMLSIYLQCVSVYAS